MPNIIRAKCAVVGDPTVGKTSLMQMLVSEGQQFPKSYTMTLGTDLLVKKVAVPDVDDVVEFFIHDSSGLDIYADLLPKYTFQTPNRTSGLSEAANTDPIKRAWWHEPNMMMVVYDVTSESSFQSVSHWVSMVRSFIPHKFSETAPGVLFANKTDLVERRTVSELMGTMAADKFELHYFEGSAKENLGVKEPFSLLAQEWHGIIDQTPVFSKA